MLPFHCPINKFGDIGFIGTVLENGRIEMPVRVGFIEKVCRDVPVLLLIVITIDGLVRVVEPSCTIARVYEVVREFFPLLRGIATGEV